MIFQKVEEVQIVHAFLHMHNILSVKRVFSNGDYIVLVRDGFLCPQAILVILKVYRSSESTG